MDNKMAINTYLSTVESKKQTSKQNRNRIIDRYGDHLEGYQVGSGIGRMKEKVQGLRSTSKQLQKSHRDVRYSIGNGVAKELIHMTHGHEQWYGIECGNGGLDEQRKAKGGKLGQL